MNGNHLHTQDVNSFLRRSGSKDTLNEGPLRNNSINHFSDITVKTDKIQRVKSTNIPTLFDPSKVQDLGSGNDFQSKREFFENRTYTDRTQINSCSSPTNSTGSKSKVYTLYPAHSPSTGNNHSNQSLSPVKVENNQHSNNVTR